ncbi:MAG: helix-turn-helix domain-containing protein [Sneathiella sp.]|nr:helix-turn-helix domain-containing protein [Sneathiella sp.]
MLESLDARVEPFKKSDTSVIRFKRPAVNPPAARRIVVDAPCLTCNAQKQSICAGLKEGEMEEFARIVRTRLVKAGQSVYREFEEAKYFFTIVTGEVRLANLLDDGRRQVTAFNSTGDIIGDHQKGYYLSDAEAICDTVVCQIPIKALDSFVEDLPAVRSALVAKIKDEANNLRRLAILLGRKTPVEKIASFLVNRAQKAGLSFNGTAEINLTMGRSDIADFLGLTIETVSRTITRLKNHGILEVPNAHSIIIKDMVELESLAEGEK